MARIDELAGKDWQAAAAGAAASRAGLTFSAPVWHDVDTDGLTQQWSQLACNAATPNPFFEAWFLLPSLAEFDPKSRVHLAMLTDQGRLVGLMPVWRNWDYHGYRLPHLANWCHANCFCGEPLVLPGYEEAYWRALLDWSERRYRASLFLHLNALPADGASYTALDRLCSITDRPFRIVHREQRAMLSSGPTVEEHMRACLVKKRRKELARKRRRLEEMGDFVFRRQCDDAGLEQWIDDFLALERSGWKGEEGSALACDPRTETVFRLSFRQAAELGRLERLAFYIDQRPIAMLCNFVTPPASFSFKTAYDESLAKLSPGLLLQVENLGVLDRPEIAWSDSCAAPGHPMIDHFWRDRREMTKVNVAIGGPLRRRVGTGLMTLESARAERRP